MSGPSTIRRATPADAALLAGLGRATFMETFGHLYPEADLAAFLDGAYTEARQRRELEDPHWVSLVAEGEAGALGFAQLIGGSAFEGHDLPDPVELNRIYLLKASQGTGLGNALMDACLQAAVALGGRSLWLGVWEHNAKAQAFYRRWGFEQIGEHVFMVGSRADTDHILARRLPGHP